MSLIAGAMQDAAARAARALGDRLRGWTPRAALILGSGLGGLAARIDVALDAAFADIPGFPDAGVHGHSGRVVAGTLEDVPVLAFGGRWHLYEGYEADVAALPVRVAHALGARTLFVSNAAGGIRRSLRAGDLMIIRDHINLMWRNPLAGPAAPNETRFPDMSSAYDPALVAALRAAGSATGIALGEGVYAAVLGPSYETPAEIRMLDRMGADAVGMSTVPEVVAARALGMRAAGVSLITNPAAGLGGAVLDHAEVLAAGGRAASDFERLVRDFVHRAFPAPREVRRSG